MPAKSNKNQSAQLLLRVGLAFVFLYAAVASLLSPQDWIGYLPQAARNLIPAATLLKVISVYEIVLVLWLLSGKYLRYAAGLCALTLTGIVLSNLSIFVVTFRDIALIFAALALFVMAD